MTIKDAISQLKNGSIVAIPTETVYGLAAVYSNENAVTKIFTIKERPFFDPLIVHIAMPNQLDELTTNFSPIAKKLAEKFWPGPITFITPKSNNVPDIVTSGLATVAVRMPAHPIAQAIIRECGPLAAPSANKFGKTSPTSFEHVYNEFGDTVAIVDGGNCEVGLESTVVEVNNDIVHILRPGKISAEDIKNEVGNSIEVTTISSIASPGHLKNHYMPSKPLIILDNDSLDSKKIIAACSKKLGYEVKTYVELKLDKEPLIIARELYSDMRRLSKLNSDVIVVLKNKTQKGNLWTAIWDRLEKAAVK